VLYSNVKNAGAKMSPRILCVCHVLMVEEGKKAVYQVCSQIHLTLTYLYSNNQWALHSHPRLHSYSTRNSGAMQHQLAPFFTKSTSKKQLKSNILVCFRN
jgi:hypothetical protein